MLCSDDIRPKFDRVYSALEEIENRCTSEREIKNVQRVREELDLHISQTVCLGMNSGKYDIGLIQDELVHILKDKFLHVIKKGSAFMKLATEKIVLLDKKFYLGEGVSLDSFLEAYGDVGGLRKMTFPYEYITSMSQTRR